MVREFGKKTWEDKIEASSMICMACEAESGDYSATNVQSNIAQTEALTLVLGRGLPIGISLSESRQVGSSNTGLFSDLPVKNRNKNRGSTISCTDLAEVWSISG